jgi:hypothetical protein
MKLLRSRSALAAFFTLFAISAAVAKPSSPILETRCTEDAGRNYSLYVTVPTGGYKFSVVRTTAKGILNIVIKYTPPSGFVTQALVTHRLRFTFENVLRPSRYSVTANGKILGRPQPIVLRGEARIQ